MVVISKERQEENEALVEFIVEECEVAKEPFNILDKIREFIGIRGTNTNVEALRTFLRTYGTTKVREIKDEAKRARQLFSLGVPVDQELLEELEKCAHVTLDKNQKIVKYVSHDGSLVLEGDHRHSTRIKKIIAEKRKSQVMKLNNMEEEEEEEDDDDAPEPSAPKKPRVPVPVRVSGSRSAGSSASQLPTSSNSASQSTDNRHDPSPASPVTTPGQAPNPTEVNSSTPKAEALDHVPIKVENPEHQNILEPKDVKPDLYEPPREGILSPTAHKTLITNIQTLILTQKLPIDQDIVLKLVEAKKNVERVEMFGAPNRNAIRIDDFVAEILHTVSLARRNSFDSHAEESKSLQNFLLCLQFSVANLQMEELKELETKLMESVEDPANLNRIIPLNKMGKAMGSILDLLVPN